MIPIPVVKFMPEGVAAVRLWPKGRLGEDLFPVYRRAIEGARYLHERKLNVAPIDRVPGILVRLREAGFAADVDPVIIRALAAHTAQAWSDLQGAKERIAALDRALAARGEKLRDYQRSGAEWLVTRHGAVLADEQGTGKSLTTLLTLPANAPTLVICPASVKSVWARETRRWRPSLAVTVLEGRGSFRWPEPGEIVVINFDVLPDAHRESCRDQKCEGCVLFPGCPTGCVMIVDEAHKIKNPRAQRTRACRALTRQVRAKEGRSYVLTGTPLQNRPEELWNVFQAADVALEAFGSWAGFVACFNGTKEAIYTKDKEGKRVVRHIMKWGSPTDEAADRIRRVFLRRTKADVAKDLPSKSWKTIPVAIDQKTLKKCDELLKEIGGADELVRLLSEGGKVAFEKMSETRAALCAAKIPTMLEAIEPYEEADEPLLVFAWHRSPIDYLEERAGWAVITGDTPTKERELTVDRFQAGELKGLGATIQAAGTGLTLTRSSNVLFVDRSWNPADNAQAEDRVHRISQERPVTITLLVAEHALDERVQELLTAKQALIDGSVEKARDTR